LYAKTSEEVLIVEEVIIDEIYCYFEKVEIELPDGSIGYVKEKQMNKN